MEADDQQPPSGESSPKPPEPSPTSPPSLSDEEAQKVLERAAREAAENEARRAATPLMQVPMSLADRMRRLCSMDQEEAAVRARTERLGEARERARRVEALLHQTGVPRKYAGISLEQIDAVPEHVRPDYRERVSLLKNMLGAHAMLLLLGPRGTGKTWMSCALVQDFCRGDKSAMYCEAMDYFLELDETINARGSVLRVERKYLRPRLLVIDAMEERADTPAKDRMLTRLINKRYAAELSTVLVSNETTEQFALRIGESVSDRIRDGGGKIECTWPSLRGQIDPSDGRTGT